MPMIPKGTKVRIWRDECDVDSGIRTKELTLVEEEHTDVRLSYGEFTQWEKRENLIPANAVIHVESRKEYNELLECLEDVGYMTCGHPRITEWDIWDRKKEETCIDLGSNSSDGCIGFDKSDHWRQKGCQIIPFSVLKAGKQWEEEKPSLRVRTPEEVKEDLQPYKLYPLPYPAYKMESEQITPITAEELYVKPNQTFMQKLTTGVKYYLKEYDDQMLYKAGYLNGTFELSEKGKESFINNLYLAEGDFKKAKKGMVSEAEEITNEAKN